MKFIQALLCVFTVINCNGQALEPGDRLPSSLAVQNVINTVDSALDFSTLSGKLVLLDFWGLDCISCIKALPEIDSIQQEFPGRLQVVLVNRESKYETEAFFRKYVKAVKPRAPLVTTDSLLNRLFPHAGSPYHVWIAPGGKVLYQADARHTTAPNIEKVLAGEDIRLPVATVKGGNRYIETMIAGEFRPLLSDYSYIGRSEPSIKVEPHNGEGKGEYLSFTGYSPVRLYQAAFRGLEGIEFDKPGRTVLENYFLPVKAGEKEGNYEWKRKYAYTYQLYSREGTRRRNYAKMKSDLDSYFPVTARIEKRMVKGWALVQKTGVAVKKSRGGEPFSNLVQLGVWSTARDSVRSVRNLPVDRLASGLKPAIETALGPFVSEVKYAGNIDFEINGDAYDKLDIKELRRALQRSGFDLVPRSRLLDVLVIRGK